MNKRLLYLLPVFGLPAAAYLLWSPYEELTASASGPGADKTVMLPAPRVLPEESPAEQGSSPESELDRPPVAAAEPRASCTVIKQFIPRPDGTLAEVMTCEPENPAVRHDYDSYADAALESLAYADAKAAEVLGMRLRERDAARSLSLILRASALADGDPAPVAYFMNAYPRPTEIDGQPVPRAVQEKFVLASVVDLLSGDSNLAAYWETKIRLYSASPDAEIAMLQAQVSRLLADMRAIQIEVTGKSTIGGQGDA